MPWKEHGVMEERFRFIEDWRKENWTMTELCRQYGVTRATGYKWLERYESGGVDGLREQSRAAKHHPNQISAATEDLVIGLRGKHSSWGAPKNPRPLGKGLPANRAAGGEYDRRDFTTQWAYDRA